MSKIFTRTFRVRYSETNANGWVGPAEYLKFLVETAYDWGESGGFGARDSQQLGITWVIRESEFAFFHPLRHNDVFQFTIWMVEWKRVRGYRAYELRLNGDGLLVARGTQQIVSLDSQTLRPKVPPEDIMDYYRLENPRIFDTFAGEISSRFPNLPGPAQGKHRAQRLVEWRDIDSLGHVNNAVYATFIEQAYVQALAESGWTADRLKQENLALIVRRIYLKYLIPAVWGETLETTSYLLELHEYGSLQRVEIKRPSDEALILESFVDWQLGDADNLQAKPLPESLAQILHSEKSV